MVLVLVRRGSRGRRERRRTHLRRRRLIRRLRPPRLVVVDSSMARCLASKALISFLLRLGLLVTRAVFLLAVDDDDFCFSLAYIHSHTHSFLVFHIVPLPFVNTYLLTTLPSSLLSSVFPLFPSIPPGCGIKK